MLDEIGVVIDGPQDDQRYGATKVGAPFTREKCLKLARPGSYLPNAKSLAFESPRPRLE